MVNSKNHPLFREEVDSLGKVMVPIDKYYGAQTQRSLDNFPIGKEKMPIELVHAIAIVKRAAAEVNAHLGLLNHDKMKVIVQVVTEVLEGKHDDNFVLAVWQTGSGTQTNMNVNEVISNRAIEILGGVRGSKSPIHPNDDVNKSQSSNDVFPTAMHVSLARKIQLELLPSLEVLQEGLMKKVEDFSSIVKVGRTHLMDATPLTLGQEFSGYYSQITHCIESLHRVLPSLCELAIGGTAVGTGLNSPKGFDVLMAQKISEITGISFSAAPNKFEALASSDCLVEVSGVLKRIACSFMKLANDIRWLASGPRCGINEIFIPDNEPGSSIMPGKVNPTQCEAMTMVAVQVMGCDAAVGFACSQGNFELNVFKPVIIYNLLQAVQLLADMARNFFDKCLKDIRANPSAISKHLEQCLMLATALNPVIGYDKAAKVVQKAYHEHLSLKEAALQMGVLTEAEFDQAINPMKMTNPLN